MYDICCVGHITLDKVVTPSSVNYMPGGTSFYFSNAIQHLDVRFTLVTATGAEEQPIINDLKNKGISVNHISSAHTVYFENIYSENQNHRTQRVTQKADPFSLSCVESIAAKIFHLGPLLSDDIPIDIIRQLAQKAIVSLDAQGYLREVRDEQVFYADWAQKKEALPYVHILKANEFEMEALTGCTDVYQGARALADFGVKEVVITLGDQGSVIYVDGQFYHIPAYIPKVVTDATGCGDTYMAGYLYKRNQGAGFQAAGEFAAAMSTLKIEGFGPFTGKESDVQQVFGRAIQNSPIKE